jgi:hypothetical protein
MQHPTDDELIEHFCGEADSIGRARIEAHIVECGRCQRAWSDLTAALTMVNDAVPEPPEHFERVIWARVRLAIAEPVRAPWTWRQIVPVGALAAAVIIGVAISGIGRTGSPAPEAVSADADAAADVRQTERVLYAALDQHLQQAAALLVELRNAPDRDVLGLERTTADDLIADGRLYRQTAELTGHERLVRMLDELEPVLVEMARSPEAIDPRNREWLRTRIDEDNLLFKVRAVTNDIRERVAHND